MNTIGIRVVASLKYGAAAAPPIKTSTFNATSGHALEACRSLVGEAMLELEVSPFDVAELGETVDHRFKVGMLLFGAGGMPEIAHDRNLAGGLGVSDAANCNRRAAGEE